MTLSIAKQPSGPLWPLGLIVVSSTGTPVSIMSLVDSTSLNAPDTATVAYGPTTTATQYEYASVEVEDIIITPMKSVGPVVANTGAIYVILNKIGAGTGNKTDSGATVMTIATGAAPTHLKTMLSNLQSKINPYNIYIDADNSNDGALVTLLI